jgi:uncharacterized membrane protein HdeD (DUF308 family)
LQALPWIGLQRRTKEVDMPTDTMWNRVGGPGLHHGDLDLDPPGAQEGERRLARTWKVIAAQGVLWVGVGVVLVAWPEPGSRTLGILMSVVALAVGLLSGFAAFGVQLLRGARPWLVLEAVVAITVGVALVALPGQSSTSLLYVIAAWALTKGVLEVTAARRLPLSGGRELLLFWSGIVSVAFGLVMLIEAAEGTLALLGLIAGFAIVTGVMQIVFALELRPLSRRAVP